MGIMDSGNEMDVLIHTQVMGRLTYIQYPNRKMRWNKDGVVHPVPSYSTEIQHAWEVVEKIRETRKIYISMGNDSHSVILDSFLNGPMFGGESIPHAICLAALQAVGVKI